MANRNYNKGVRKERKIVNQAKALGYYASRNAGSHGIWDVTIVDVKLKKIRFLQVKPENYTGADRLIEEFIELNGTFDVTFEVV